MPMDFVTYLSQINNAIIAENGNDLAYLLRPTSPQGKDLVKEFRNPTVRHTFDLMLHVLRALVRNNLFVDLRVPL